MSHPYKEFVRHICGRRLSEWLYIKESVSWLFGIFRLYLDGEGETVPCGYGLLPPLFYKNDLGEVVALGLDDISSVCVVLLF